MQQGRCAFSCIHPNASTHGPPISSAVLMNLGPLPLITSEVLLTELATRPHPAVKRRMPQITWMCKEKSREVHRYISSTTGTNGQRCHQIPAAAGSRGGIPARNAPRRIGDRANCEDCGVLFYVPRPRNTSCCVRRYATPSSVSQPTSCRENQPLERRLLHRRSGKSSGCADST